MITFFLHWQLLINVLTWSEYRTQLTDGSQVIHLIFIRCVLAKMFPPLLFFIRILKNFIFVFQDLCCFLFFEKFIADSEGASERWREAGETQFSCDGILRVAIKFAYRGHFAKILLQFTGFVLFGFYSLCPL